MVARQTQVNTRRCVYTVAQRNKHDKTTTNRPTTGKILGTTGNSFDTASKGLSGQVFGRRILMILVGLWIIVLAL